MGIVNKFEEYQMETFMEQHGDRITPVYGRLLSVKIERKKKFLIRHVLEVNLVVKPVGSRNVARCKYKKSGFKKPEFIDLRQGNEVLVQGLKGDKNKKNKESSEIITIMNVVNITDRTQLVEGDLSVDEVIKSIKGNIQRQRV